MTANEWPCYSDQASYLPCEEGYGPEIMSALLLKGSAGEIMWCWMTTCQPGNYQGPALTLQIYYNNAMAWGRMWDAC